MALQKLNAADFSPKVAYNIGYITKKVSEITRDGRSAFTKIAKKYGKTDENGDLVPEMDENENPVPGTFQFKDEESKELFNKDQEEFMSIEHELSKDKMSIDLLGDVKMSANDISALKPLFSDLD
jgi:hypothetical protein